MRPALVASGLGGGGPVRRVLQWVADAHYYYWFKSFQPKVDVATSRWKPQGD